MSSESGPWASLNMDELLRILEQNKTDGENRRVAFHEKLETLKERQESLQQRRIARLRKDGIVLDLDDIKRKSNPKKISKLFEDDVDDYEKRLARQKLIPQIKEIIDITGDLEVDSSDGSESNDEIIYVDEAGSTTATNDRNARLTRLRTPDRPSEFQLIENNADNAKSSLHTDNVKVKHTKHHKHKLKSQASQQKLKKAGSKGVTAKHPRDVLKRENSIVHPAVQIDKPTDEITKTVLTSETHEKSKLQTASEKFHRATSKLKTIQAFQSGKTSLTPRTWNSKSRPGSRGKSFYESLSPTRLHSGTIGRTDIVPEETTNLQRQYGVRK